ncbi:hypothetical protein HX049_17930 [Myroides odoratimimus]|nr:hypothetical protein [Myroides odoratimimus]
MFYWALVIKCTPSTNSCSNKRNSQDNKDDCFNEQLYKERYASESSNVWLDSFGSLLNRYDTILSYWMV